MNPTLYDILGVAPDASAGQIKRAWRDAAERFEPGSGGSAAQFRLFNEAAETLLDPERRQEYDAQAGLSPTAAAGPATRTLPATSTQRTATAATTSARDATVTDGTATDATPADGTGVRTVPAGRPAAAGGEPGPAPAPGRAVPWPVLLGLAVLAAVLVALAAGPFIPGMGLAATRQVVAQDGLDEARRAAPAAAERAAEAILAYDYRSLEADRDAAADFMTDDYRKDYLDTFDSTVIEGAEKLKAKVTAQVRASGVSLATEDRVQVLLFVDQVTTSTANDEPQTALNRVMFTMQKARDGSWLVDDITSY
ncbi:J domain-containing protein [Nocardioides mesophilus]|uniref:J domain-containing protein n=1 Tax=Nocardioides mesophilus TaxID=433659 RepID=A0A7G9R6Z4_9ACTN|nr:J domain-containing protein [Nocardioides mesophilus]QNN51369.1 J domain-containing protein [Nocardioides mesophilus]